MILLIWRARGLKLVVDQPWEAAKSATPTYALQGRVLGNSIASSCDRKGKFHLMLAGDR